MAIQGGHYSRLMITHRLLQVVLLCFFIRRGHGAAQSQTGSRSSRRSRSESFQWPSDRPVDTDFVLKPSEAGGGGGEPFLKWSG